MNKKIFYPFLSFISVILVLTFTKIPSLSSQTLSNNQQAFLPNPKVHNLPPSLSKYPETSDNYFTEIKKLPVGYLIWSEFPIKVYIEQAEANLSPYAAKRFETWINLVKMAVLEWHKYLPLTIINNPEDADIKILRSRPAIRAKLNQKTRQLDISRARSGETKYELYIKKTANNEEILAHKCTVQVSPEQSDKSIQATARHEIGHALGIWGHSPQPTDVMYFSQVRNSPSISPRDLGTLKMIYQQPTSLGWKL